MGITLFQDILMTFHSSHSSPKLSSETSSSETSSSETSSSETFIVELTPEEFHQLSNPPRLIDVRSGVEYRLFHAPNAVNLSLPRIMMGQISLLQSWFLPTWFRNLPKTEAIALICLTSHRSPIAAQRLAQAGFTTVFNITGGMLAWKKAGLPIEKGAPPTTTA